MNSLKISILCLGLIGSIKPLAAQAGLPGPGEPLRWADPAAVFSFLAGTGGQINEAHDPTLWLGTRAALTIPTHQILVTFAGSFLGNLSRDPVQLMGRRVFDYNLDAGVLIGGRLPLPPDAFATFSAGGAFTLITDQEYRLSLTPGWELITTQKSRTVPTFGVPWHTQLVFTLSRSAGLGLDVFGNVNRENSFWGLGISINLASYDEPGRSSPEDQPETDHEFP